LGKGKIFIRALILLLTLFLSAASALAIDAVDASQNPRWHCSEKTATATFLAGDKAEPASLILKKEKAMGQTLTITADADYITLQSGDSPHVSFKIPSNPDGTATKILMTGGDQPTLFFNDKEQIQQQGKWIQIYTNSASTITLTLGTTSFAKVKFDPPVSAPPAPAPKPAASAIEPQHELLKTVSPTQLKNCCYAFDQGINKKCTLCSGTGKVSVQVQSGSHNVGPYSVPDYRTEEKKCDRCNGTGIDRAKDDVIIKLSGLMVKDMAAVKKDDDKTQKVLTDAYEEITKDMIGNEKTWITLTKDGRSILAQSSPKPGTTVVSLVEVKKSIHREGDKRRFLVRVIGTDKEVYVDDPVLADEMKSGHALMGGIVDDPIVNGEQKTTVLRGGFLIAPQVSHDWWWWYKDN
jgi:hypothetical protein